MEYQNPNNLNLNYIQEHFERVAMREVKQVEDELVSMCSVIAAGVPMNDVFVQAYRNQNKFTTFIGLSPQKPFSLTSTVYRME